MHYQINGFLKHAEVDNWESGCTGECHSYYVDHKITGFTFAELIEKCEAFTGGEVCPDLIENNRLDFQATENADGYPASESELEKFKRGEIVLYLCDYSAIVQKVENADLTEEFAAFKSARN